MARLFEKYQSFKGRWTTNISKLRPGYENKKSQASLQYFWRILDEYKQEAIATFLVNMVFRAIIKKLKSKERFGFKVDEIGHSKV